MKLTITVVLLLALSCCSSIIYGQNAPAKVVAGIPVNYNEDSVGIYTLPDPLIFLNGKKVKNAKTWYNKRRTEIV